MALNTAEGNRSQGGHRTARFSTAAGSTAESRTALSVAVAWGYVKAQEIEAGEALLDRIAAMIERTLRSSMPSEKFGTHSTTAVSADFATAGFMVDDSFPPDHFHQL